MYGMVWYGMVWYGMVWYGMVWYGMVWYGMVWYGMVWYGMVWYGMVWYGMVWYGMVWYGMVWYGMVWYGMVWYGMVWYGMVWYGMVWYVCMYVCIYVCKHIRIFWVSATVCSNPFALCIFLFDDRQATLSRGKTQELAENTFRSHATLTSPVGRMRSWFLPLSLTLSACIYAQIITSTYVYFHTHIHIHTHIHVHAHVHIHIHIHTHLQACIYIHTHRPEKPSLAPHLFARSLKSHAGSLSLAAWRRAGATLPKLLARCSAGGWFTGGAKGLTSCINFRPCPGQVPN